MTVETHLKQPSASDVDGGNNGGGAQRPLPAEQGLHCRFSKQSPGFPTVGLLNQQLMAALGFFTSQGLLLYSPAWRFLRVT